MLELERIGNEVFYKGQKLTIVDQATKGPNKESVKILGLPESNGQKWISLSKLSQGINELECNGRSVKSKKYVLTKEEEEEIKELESRINEIKAKAKARYVEKPNLDVNPSKMSEEERKSKIEEIIKYYGLNIKV